MKTIMRRSVLFLLVAGACGPVPDPTADPDGGFPEDLPPCPEAAVLLEVDPSDHLLPLADGSSLGVTLGFQGFLFTRVILRSADEPRSGAPVYSKVKVDGLPEQSQSSARVKSAHAPGGSSFDTGPILIFFNDAALAELVARTASIRVTGAMKTCRVSVQLMVTLADGGRQDPDGGISTLGDR